MEAGCGISLSMKGITVNQEVRNLPYTNPSPSYHRQLLLTAGTCTGERGATDFATSGWRSSLVPTWPASSYSKERRSRMNTNRYRPKTLCLELRASGKAIANCRTRDSKEDTYEYSHHDIRDGPGRFKRVTHQTGNTSPPHPVVTCSPWHGHLTWVPGLSEAKISVPERFTAGHIYSIHTGWNETRLVALPFILGCPNPRYGAIPSECPASPNPLQSSDHAKRW